MSTVAIQIIFIKRNEETAGAVAASAASAAAAAAAAATARGSREALEGLACPCRFLQTEANFKSSCTQWPLPPSFRVRW